MTHTLLTTTDLTAFIREHHIAAEIVLLADETPTVATAAAAFGAHPDQIGKSILFLVDGRPLLVIANGDARLNYKRLADHLSTSRRRIKLANAQQVAAILGYPVGTVPPFGHRQPVPTLIEAGVMNQRELYAGGGGSNALLRITAAELQRVLQASIIPLANKP
jgi:prolyl-tRNA editing enzyme YbaK/EbsC (Cys-tRNA(Pro) deacylase)